MGGGAQRVNWGVVADGGEMGVNKGKLTEMGCGFGAVSRRYSGGVWGGNCVVNEACGGVGKAEMKV